MCPNHRSGSVLSCAEAAVRRRGDFTLGRLPLDQPIPRVLTDEATEPAAAGPTEPVHGTPWGYQRGCRVAQACPNWRRGRQTCAEARRRYFAQYTRRRREGSGSAIAHGTVRGYSAGCRAGDQCNVEPHGRTCADAWREYKMAHARRQGVRPLETGVPPGEAAFHVKRWIEQGMSRRSIAARVGIGRTTVGELLAYARGAARGRTLFHPETVSKVLATAGTESIQERHDE